jgi:short-subunit dehydrogenase
MRYTARYGFRNRSQWECNWGKATSSLYYDAKGAVYQPSKATLNMYKIDLAHELRDTAFQVNVVDPGFTATDFNNHRGTSSVEVAGARIARVAMLGPDGPTRTFISEENETDTGQIPW